LRHFDQREQKQRQQERELEIKKGEQTGKWLDSMRDIYGQMKGFNADNDPNPEQTRSNLFKQALPIMRTRFPLMNKEFDAIEQALSDGVIDDVTDHTGLGTSAANVQTTHTYSTAGTFIATAILTDEDTAVSDVATCSIEITVTDTEGSDGEETGTSSPTPTIADPGPTETIVGIGVLGGVLFLIGTLLFFAL